MDGSPRGNRFGEGQSGRRTRKPPLGAFSFPLNRVRLRARSSVRFDPCRYGEADATDEFDPLPRGVAAARKIPLRVARVRLTVRIVQIEFLIGEQRYVLGENDARWLEERIRITCVDESHRPIDADALPCLQLADLLSDDLESRRDGANRAQPVARASGLTEHVLAGSPEYDHEIQALNVALLRYRAKNDF